MLPTIESSWLRHPVRSGMSMMEILIAMSIFLTLMAMTYTAMITMSRYEIQAELGDDLVLQANSAVRVMYEDLSIAGWHFADPLEAGPDSGYAGNISVSQANTLLTMPSGGYIDRLQVDRSLTYFPFVQIQSPDGTQITNAVGVNNLYRGLGQGFTYSHRPRDMVLLPDLPDNMPGDPIDFDSTFQDTASITPSSRDGGLTPEEEEDYRNSFYARSQELIFLRTTAREFDPNPSEQEQTIIPFPDGFDWNETDDLDTDGDGVVDQFGVRNRHFELGVLRMQDFDVPRDVDGDRDYTATVHDRTVPTYTDPGDVVPANLIVNDAVWLDTSGSEPTLRVRWETMVAESDPIPVSPTSDELVMDPDDLRHFHYCVVPSTLPNSLGRLVRAYRAETDSSREEGTDPGEYLSRDSNYDLVVDAVLCEHCVRVVFETYRTSYEPADPRASETAPWPSGEDWRAVDGDVTNYGLAVNQIRVRLYMATNSVRYQDEPIYRIYTATIAMRTRNNHDQIAEDLETLGPVGTGIFY